MLNQDYAAPLEENLPTNAHFLDSEHKCVNQIESSREKDHFDHNNAKSKIKLSVLRQGTTGLVKDLRDWEIPWELDA